MQRRKLSTFTNQTVRVKAPGSCGDYCKPLRRRPQIGPKHPFGDRIMKVALVQTDILWNEPARNIDRCAALADDAIRSGAELLIFPEMFPCGFSKPTGELAQACYEAGLQFINELASKRGVAAIGSLPQPVSPTEVFNTALVCKPDGSVESYRKIHLFSYGDEGKSYSKGTSTLTTSIQGLRCSVFICYDLRFPLPFYDLAEKTDLYVVVANWPTGRREHWLTLLRARAIENQAYVAGVNRTGRDPELAYSGDSVLFAPDGTQLTELSSDERVIISEVVASRVSEWRTTFPALRDRRPDIYKTIGGRP
jgi:predicted amidohydrolase